MTKREYAMQKSKERMTEAVANLRTSEGWLRWLKVRTKFHRYSFRNTILIACQYPEATRVAGAGKWRREFDRHIKKGSTAIWILAPMKVKDRDDPERTKLFFKGVKVFDVSQTEPNDPDNVIELDPPGSIVGGDSHNAYLVRCVEACDRMGWPLTFEDINQPGVLGFHTKDDEIVIQRGLEPNRQLRILIHEMTHALGVDYEKFSREEAECICDSTTYIVGNLIGLDVSEETISYVTTSSG